MRLLAVLLIGIGTLTAAGADEIEDRLELGLELYGQGKYREAAQELQYALGEIQSKRDASYVSLLPAPLAGWRASEPSADATNLGMLSLGVRVTRDYYALEGRGHASVEIVGDSPMTAALAMVLSNPMLTQMDPDSKPYRKDGQPGLVKHAPGSDRWEIMVLVDGRVLLTVSTENVADQSVAEAYVDAVELRQVAAAFAP